MIQRRSKGDGSIFQRKDGRWVTEYKPEGAKNAKTIYGKTRKDVEKKLRAFIRETIKYDYTEVKRMSLQNYMDNWLYNVKANELKPKSMDALECTIKNQVYKYLGSFQIANIARNDIQEMINSLASEGYSYETIKKAYDAVNGCLKYGVNAGEIANNPCVGKDGKRIIVLPAHLKRKKNDVVFFDQDQINLIRVEAVAKLFLPTQNSLK